MASQFSLAWPSPCAPPWWDRRAHPDPRWKTLRRSMWKQGQTTRRSTWYALGKSAERLPRWRPRLDATPAYLPNLRLRGGDPRRPLNVGTGRQRKPRLYGGCEGPLATARRREPYRGSAF